MTTRRTILRGLSGGTAMLMLGLAGGAEAVTYGESPALAELVKAGKLPPVAQRLPTEPEVVTPLEGVGKYGGRIRFGLRGSSDYNNTLRMVGPQGLVRWNPDYTVIIPNVAKSWDVNDNATVFTFHLRPGMKWSDGTPFTADDIMFNMQDMVLAGTLAPTAPRYMAGGQPVKVEKVDDVTVRFTFAAPYGDFLAELASPLGQHPVFYQKKYCSQFLPKYNPEAEAKAKAAGSSDWKTYFTAQCGDIEVASRWGNPQRPVLDPWLVKEPYVGGAVRVVMERNPYFWQVDNEGHQLPYLDELFSPIAQDVESLILEAVGGKIDFQIRHLDQAANRPVLAQNREKGGYEFVEAKPIGGANMNIDWILMSLVMTWAES